VNFFGCYDEVCWLLCFRFVTGHTHLYYHHSSQAGAGELSVAIPTQAAGENFTSFEDSLHFSWQLSLDAFLRGGHPASVYMGTAPWYLVPAAAEGPDQALLQEPRYCYHFRTHLKSKQWCGVSAVLESHLKTVQHNRCAYKKAVR